MTAKGQTNWPPEKLEEWAKPALAHPELIEIARTATSNNEAKNKASELVTETREDLAQACRWLRILRVNYPARLERLISQTEPNSNQEEKKVEKSEIVLYADEIEVKPQLFRNTTTEGMGVLLKVNTPHAMADNALIFLQYLKEKDYKALVGYMPMFMAEFRDKMIQILEEKFELKIKICGNCKFWGYRNTEEWCSGNKLVSAGKTFFSNGVTLNRGCWAPKEVPEKKEEKQETLKWGGGHAFDGDPASHVRPLR